MKRCPVDRPSELAAALMAAAVAVGIADVHSDIPINGSQLDLLIVTFIRPTCAKAGLAQWLNRRTRVSADGATRPHYDAARKWENVNFGAAVLGSNARGGTPKFYRGGVGWLSFADAQVA
jgi:hypothetical protein